jgi:hypothetical protein
MPRRQTEDEIALGMAGAAYLSVKESEDALALKKKASRTEIERLLESPEIPLQMNGAHREITVQIPGTDVSIFFQKQHRESVCTVDNILDVIKNKLGDKADRFIVQIPTLASNALEQMLLEGLITNTDLEEWTVTKVSTALIVKEKDKK